ncbi:protein kinase [Streptomyces sp. SID8382]|uniref:serine/threonine-protein kinase n=1 Tax=Streptomyces malaysiensis TaxID=92644 RepID=UPI000C2C1651|nr:MULTISPECIES: serine/threonine-protein kinase [unclassified Streptomyces]AUA11892.1 Serine/threonine-protein kinase PknG [Streptomyces sp. M56]MYX59894.1 protein kinase [Streptomyces sp. SID8382]
MTSCVRPDCRGEGLGRINARGFCSECGRRALPTAPTPPPAAPPPSSGARPGAALLSGSTATTARARRRDVARKFTVRPPGEDPLALPRVELPSLRDLVMDDPRPPSRGQTCGREGCDEIVGTPYAGQPALSRGYCPRCRHPFDFTPRLSPGDLLGDQYRVVGCVGYGGLGWVYLAEDTQLDDQPVAIKGLINNEDEAALRTAVEERRYLTVLDHPGIVRIINYVTQPDPRDGALTGYIVMEFVDGMTLAQIKDHIADAVRPYDGPRLYEHILAYGCLVLRAVGYLHGEKLLYCDLKPSNVMHHEDRVKVIDLGAVRRLGQRDGGPPVITEAFAAPEVLARGASALTERHDLFGVGRTLEELSESATRQAQRPPGLGAESYRRVLARATAADPERRFGSAAEMSEQLWGVLREIHSLRLSREQPQPSTLFAPTSALLDSSLGRIPDLERWLDGEPRPPLASGLPRPEQVPLGLPVPFPDTADPGAALLGVPTDSGPRRLIEQLHAFPRPSAEIRLRTCRAYLELGEREAAAQELAVAVELIGSAAPYNWRLSWHRALLRLADGAVADARREFDEVYSALPGEYAPKLALGYCAEHLGDHEAAKRFYDAVWQRNRSQGSAAFGLARLRLAAGDRGGAVDILGGVPKVSRHYDAARIAIVRVLSGRLGRAEGGAALPTAEDLAEVRTRLPRLYLDEGRESGPARDRLTAESLEVTLDWAERQSGSGPLPDRASSGRWSGWGRPRRRGGGHLPAVAGGEPSPEKGPLPIVFGEWEDESALRAELEQTLRRLARQADSPGALGTLIDRANAIRPMTRV